MFLIFSQFNPLNPVTPIIFCSKYIYGPRLVDIFEHWLCTLTLTVQSVQH